MTAITANFNDAMVAKLTEFAAEEKITVPELIQRKILDWLEDQEDLRDAKAILADEDDEIISHEEFWRDLES